MNFVLPAYLFLLLILPVLGCLYIYSIRKKERILSRFSQPGPLKLTNPFLKHKAPVLAKILITVSLGFFIIAAARPRWGSETEVIERNNSQVIFLLDISLSMTAKDVLPDRLQLAKQEINNLLNQLQGEQTGLVLFSAVSVLRCLLTSDYEALRWFVKDVSCADTLLPGTDIGLALKTACAVFDNHRTGGGRSIILATDGEDHEGNVIQAVREAVEKNIIIHVIGVGEKHGSPIVLKKVNGSFKKGADGEIVISRLNESLLKEIASNTGGIYVKAGSKAKSIDELYEQGIKYLSNPDVIGRSGKKVLKERFQWFLLGGLVLFVLGIAMDDSI